MKAILILALTCGFSAAAAADEQLEKSLNDQYRDKVLTLRHPLKTRSQDYAPDGTPANFAEEGAWTLYGQMAVNQIKVDADRLRVEGKRALYLFDRDGHLVRFQDDRKHPAESLKIVLRLQQPLSSTDEAVAALSRVFAFTPEDAVNSVPAYWQPLLAKHFGIALPKMEGAKQTGEPVETGNQKPAEPAKPIDFANMKDMSPPSVLYHPEPSYSEAARQRRIQGVVGLNIVIGPEGNVRDVRIVHPLGMGLDDNAVKTVSTWRFAPAKREGRPVAVAVHVEVDFHLY